MGLFSKFAKAYKIADSDICRETLKSAEKIAVASYGLYDGKSPDERAQIADRVLKLTEKLNDTISYETPLIAALAPLTAIRVHHDVMEEQAKRKRNEHV